MKEIFIFKEPKNNIKTPKDLFKSIQKIDIDYDQENLIIIYLKTDNTIIDTEILFKGGLNECTIDPKTIFRKALLKNANSIIIAHNHPSNNIKPSEPDKEVYYKLKKAGKMINIKVLDSMIFNKKEFYSIEQ